MPERPKPVDAGTPGDCAAACARLAQLGCEEAADAPPATPSGSPLSCVQVCEQVEASGAVTLHPACVATIATCAEIETKCAYGSER